MYSREIDGAARSFGVSGKLWHGVLVMFDRETGSFWTQVDGRSIQGEELGRMLEHVPSVFTTWGAWVDAHPDTLVLEKSGAAKGMTRSNYADYFADPDRLFLEHLDEGLGDGVEPKAVVFGVRHEGDAVAVTEAQLESDRMVVVTVGGASVALARDSTTGEVRAVLVGDRVLDPLPEEKGVEPTNKVRDRETGETIRFSTLEELRVDRAFWYAWKRTVSGARLHDA